MDYSVGDTIYLMFTTRQFSDGVPTVLAGSPVVSAYENDSATQITAGITLGVSHDSVVGMNLLTIVATGANGYDAGKDYNMVITTGTVGGVSVVGEVVGTFSLDRSAAVGLIEIDAGTSPTASGLTLKSGSLAEPGDVVHILTSGNGVRGTRIINAFHTSFQERNKQGYHFFCATEYDCEGLKGYGYSNFHWREDRFRPEIWTVDQEDPGVFVVMSKEVVCPRWEDAFTLYEQYKAEQQHG